MYYPANCSSIFPRNSEDLTLYIIMYENNIQSFLDCLERPLFSKKDLLTVNQQNLRIQHVFLALVMYSMGHEQIPAHILNRMQ